MDVDQFADRLTGMVRSYVAGNLVIGVILTAISILVFWRVGLTPAVTLGLISGALNLIPFLGIMLAMVIPLIAGVFQFHSIGPFIVIGVTMVALHLIAANLLISAFCRLAPGRRTCRRNDWSSFLGLAVGSARTAACRAVNWIRETDGGSKSIFGALVESFGT